MTSGPAATGRARPAAPAAMASRRVAKDVPIVGRVARGRTAMRRAVRTAPSASMVRVRAASPASGARAPVLARAVRAAMRPAVKDVPNAPTVRAVRGLAASRGSAVRVPARVPMAREATARVPTARARAAAAASPVRGARAPAVRADLSGTADAYRFR